MFAGVNNYVFSELSLTLVPWRTAQANMSLSWSHNIFIPKNRNSITNIVSLDCIENIKSEKQMTTKQSEEYFFHQRCEETNTEMASQFRLAANIVGLLGSSHWLISVG